MHIALAALLIASALPLSPPLSLWLLQLSLDLNMKITFKLAQQPRQCAVPPDRLIFFQSNSEGSAGCTGNIKDAQHCPSSPWLRLFSPPPRTQRCWVHTHRRTQHNLKYHRANIINLNKLCPLHYLWATLPLHFPVTTHKHTNTYMLLFFRGEPTEPFLCWLREPPMATAKSVLVAGLS